MSVREISVRDEVLREWSEDEETGLVQPDGFRPSCENAFLSHYD
jgi:hypothetical protein